MRSVFFAEAFAFITALVSAAVIERQASAVSIYTFSVSGAWIINIATRQNGNLLLNRLDVPELWSFDPTTKAATKLVTFPNALSTTGITEISPDVFAVVTGKVSIPNVYAGTFAIWKVDLTGTEPKSTLVKLVPESGFFIGVTPFNNNTILIADAGTGTLYKMSMSTGEYSALLADPRMKAPSTAPIQEGIHGLKIYNDTLYFTNTFGGTFNKVKIDPETGTTVGEVTTLLTDLSGAGPEDFVFGLGGEVYVALITQGNVIKVDAAGKETTFAAASRSSSVAWGRGEDDKSTLYISTAAGSLLSVAV